MSKLFKKKDVLAAANHKHSLWHLVTIKSGIVRKCDCGAISEPKKWWEFWR